MIKEYQLPLTKEQLKGFKVGEQLYLSGIIYTARDTAHKLMSEALAKGEDLPIPIAGSIIYYVGPTQKREQHQIGSAGPTTASRMDSYTPALYDLGLIGTIGKGKRSRAVKKSIADNQAVYLIAVGGAGAYLSQCVKSAEVVGYHQLGPEAIYKLEVERFPVIIGVDYLGNDVYEEI